MEKSNWHHCLKQEAAADFFFFNCSICNRFKCFYRLMAPEKPITQVAATGIDSNHIGSSVLRIWRGCMR